MSNESKNPTRIAAAVMFMLLIGTGYAITPSVENAIDAGPVARTEAAPTVYLPAMYVNHATGGAEAHIQAF